MAKVLFLTSHLGSGHDILFNLLCENPRIEGYKTGFLYEYPLTINSLLAYPHKQRNTAAVYMDELLYNHSLSTKKLYGVCKFIYFIRQPIYSLNIGLRPDMAVDYYCFRLRRMCEMARKSGGVLVTWEDLASGRKNDILQEYLNLRQGLGRVECKLDQNFVGIESKRAEKAFEKYLCFLKSVLS